MVQLFKDYAKSTLAGGITNVATSITLAAGEGARFPAITSPDFFEGTLDNGGTTVEEVRVTARSTDTLTVTRGINGTTNVAWNSGDKFELRMTSASLNRVGTTRKAVSSVTTLAVGDGPMVTCTGTSYTLSLPTAVGNDGEPFFIMNSGASGTITVDPNGSETIGFLATWDLEKGDFVEVFSDNTQWLVRAATYRLRSKLYTTGGTHRFPQGCTFAEATVQGGGGGGGGAKNASSNGGGGAAGECRSAIINPVPGTDYTITVGAGGNAGADTPSSGTAGGSSSIGSLLSAAGGAFGASNSVGGNGAGGAATASLAAATAWGSTHKFPYSGAVAGGAGAKAGGSIYAAMGLAGGGTSANWTFGFAGGTGTNGGGGGASLWGNGANGGVGSNPGATPTANTGAGGGGGAATDGTGQTGGAGATGFVRVSWTQ